jgi:hypothetical protein
MFLCYVAHAHPRNDKTGLTTAARPKKCSVAAASEKERVLIIGGGFAGIAAGRGLKVEIVNTGSRYLSSRFSHRCWVRPRTSP